MIQIGKLIVLAIAIGVSGVQAQTFNALTKRVASDRDTTDRFGWDVDIDGNYAVVGAYADDFGSNNPNMGSVYVYEKMSSTNWQEIQKLTASDQQDYDRFGYALAIDGDYMVVGAYRQDDDENGSNNMSNAGAAYIFERNTSGQWIEIQKIVASDRSAGDEFGYAVDIHADRIIIGAQADFEDSAGLNPIHHAGSAYIFERNGAVWNEVKKISASDRTPDIVYPNGYSGEDLSSRFGSTVAIWGDYVLVGSHHDDYDSLGNNPQWSAGSAYFFERNATTWTEVKKVSNKDREGWDRFGYSVTLDSNLAVIGAYSEDETEDGISNPLTNPGSAYIFERNSSNIWNQKQKIVPNDRNSGDHFAWSVDLDGDYMVLGCHADNHDAQGNNSLNDAGSAYIFQKDQFGVWSQFQKLDAIDRDSTDELGISCGIDGPNVIVGAYQHDQNVVLNSNIEDAGAAYMYTNDICQTPINNTQNLDVCFGQSITVGANTYSSTGNYVDTVLAQNGCDSVVTTNLTVGPDLSQTDSVSICQGETYTVGTSTYSISGTYTDNFTSGSCDSTVTTVLIVQSAVNATVSQINNSLSANQSGASYQWIDCGNGNSVIAGATAQTYVAPAVGTYAVIVTEGSCSDTSSCLLVTTIVGVEEIESHESILIYPNPNNGNFEISIEGIQGNSRMEIYDEIGKMVFAQNILGSSATMHVNHLPSGLYHVRVIDDLIVRSAKLIIK